MNLLKMATSILPGVGSLSLWYRQNLAKLKKQFLMEQNIKLVKLALCCRKN
jgi:hypothetical protein